MQWWKDAVKEIYGDSDVVVPTDPTLLNLSISCWNSPIVRALEVAHQQVGFTRRFLDRLIDSRTLDLDVRQLITLDESINYAEQTVSSLLYLTLETVGVSTLCHSEGQPYLVVCISRKSLMTVSSLHNHWAGSGR